MPRLEHAFHLFRSWFVQGVNSYTLDDDPTGAAALTFAAAAGVTFVALSVISLLLAHCHERNTNDDHLPRR